MLKDLVAKGYANRPPQTWPTYDGLELNRDKFITASEIGYCSRKIVYEKTSPKVPFKNWGFAERGHTSEAWVVEQLRHSGAKLLFVGDDQRSFYDGYQSGTPDGILRTIDGDILLEFKGLDPRTNWNSLPKKKHITQVQQNIDLVNRCLDLNIKEGIILHTDCSNYQRMQESTIKFDQEYADGLRARAEKLHAIKDPAEAEPEGVYTGDCKFCDFRSRCSGAVVMASNEKAKAKETNDVAKNIFR